MLAGLLKVAGLDVKRQVRQLSLTLVFALLGAAAALMTLVIALRAFYLWLEQSLGTFPALGILGTISLLLAIIFFLLAFMRGRRRPAAAHPVESLRAGAPRATATTDAAMRATEDLMRFGSRQQVVGALIVAVIAGWILGKRL
jgi:hypothetical protein